MTDNKKNDTAKLNLQVETEKKTQSNFFDSLRQLGFSPEFRIGPLLETDEQENNQTPEPLKTPSLIPDPEKLVRSLAEVAICLWDIERKLQPDDNEPSSKKHRLAFRRINKAIDFMKEAGVVIDDPIGRKYPTGGEGMMKPHLQPTPGITVDTVTETITPIIYFNDRLIQRAEVFVAVPEEVVEHSVKAEELEQQEVVEITDVNAISIDELTPESFNTDVDHPSETQNLSDNADNENTARDTNEFPIEDIENEQPPEDLTDANLKKGKNNKNQDNKDCNTDTSVPIENKDNLEEK